MEDEAPVTGIAMTSTWYRKPTVSSLQLVVSPAAKQTQRDRAKARMEDLVGMSTTSKLR
jgi:hypothetical protein